MDLVLVFIGDVVWDLAKGAMVAGVTLVIARKWRSRTPIGNSPNAFKASEPSKKSPSAVIQLGLLQQRLREIRKENA